MPNTTARAAPPRPGRVTARESFLDLVDQLAHGDLAAWRGVYAAALADAEARAAVRRAARLVDPDFAEAGALWALLVERMPALDPARRAPGRRPGGTPTPPASR